MLNLSVTPGPGGVLSRRTFLRASLVAGGVLGLPSLIRSRASSSGKARRDTAVIQIWLGGGPSHHDMYDLKPDAPAEVRGPFKPIATDVNGLRVCELLPGQARRMS